MLRRLAGGMGGRRRGMIKLQINCRESVGWPPSARALLSQHENHRPAVQAPSEQNCTLSSNLKKRLNAIYVRHTRQPLQKIEEALERDYFLTAEMAKDFGLVDTVIAKRLTQPAEKAAG